jgi:RNA polymerase sigma-70 factor (ECF subfamily)
MIGGASMPDDPTTALADAFAAASGHTLAAAGRSLLQDAIVSAIAGARRANPGVEIDAEHFARHLGQLVGANEDPLAGVAMLRIDDLWLCLACAAGDPVAIASFDTRVLGRVDAAIAAVDTSADCVDEVKQRLREKLFVARPDRPAKIAAYRGRGSLRSWVRVVAVRETLALIERERRIVEPDDALAASLEVGRDPELAFLAAHYREAFRGSFAEALAALPARDRSVLRLQHVDHLTLDQTAAILGVHRATVARWNGRIREELLVRTKDALARGLRIDAAELESVMRLIQSNLEVSVRRLLAAE